MKIHEYQAKELLAAAGAAVPRGILASSPAEAVKGFEQIGRPVVLKAQVHAGGRGKGRFKDSGKDWGGVKFIRSREECGQVVIRQDGRRKALAPADDCSVSHWYSPRAGLLVRSIVADMSAARTSLAC